jgi:hypothetical protein
MKTEGSDGQKFVVLETARPGPSAADGRWPSEPFFSAYERLLGASHDVVVLLTDYQEKKKAPPLKLQILEWRYLEKTEIADENLCKLARAVRDPVRERNEVWAQKMFRFLAHANQSDWRARQLLGLLGSFADQEQVLAAVHRARISFEKQNKAAESKDHPLLSDTEIEAVENIRLTQPIELGVIDALDNWVIENFQDVARMPSASQFTALAEGPLNGKIGMSFALQWRYNFGRLFGLD